MIAMKSVGKKLMNIFSTLQKKRQNQDACPFHGLQGLWWVWRSLWSGHLSQFNLMAFEEGQHQSIMNCSATEQGSTSQIKWDETMQPDQPSNTSSHHTWRGIHAKPTTAQKLQVHSPTGICAHISRMVDCLKAGYWICSSVRQSPNQPDFRTICTCKPLERNLKRSGWIWAWVWEKSSIGILTPSSVVAFAVSGLKQTPALQQKHHWTNIPAKLKKLFQWNSNKISQYLTP